MKQVLALAVIATLGCASSSVVGRIGSGALSDEEIAPDSLGLVPGSVFDTPEPPVVVHRTSMPGEEPAFARIYRGTPPMIPHGLEQVMPITRADHPCQECHQIAERYEGDPTPLPVSHYTDYRANPPRRAEVLNGAWSHCLVCHVQQSDAETLVDNSFISVDELPPPKAAAKAE